MFLSRVFHVVKDISERIFENSHSLIKTYTVLTKVAGGFLRIPCEFHAQSISHFYLQTLLSASTGSAQRLRRILGFGGRVRGGKERMKDENVWRAVVSWKSV